MDYDDDEEEDEDDDELLEQQIDREWLNTEFLAAGAMSHRQTEQKRGLATPSRSNRLVDESPKRVTIASPKRITPMASWSATPEISTSGSAARLQRSIEELERKIAEATVTLSDAERKASQRRTAKQRQAQRILRTEAAPYLSPPNIGSAPSPPCLPRATSAPADLSRLGMLEDVDERAEEIVARSDDGEDGASATESEAAAEAGLTIVLSELATRARDDGGGGGGGGWPREAMPSALQLAGAARRLWHALSQSDWKRRANAAVTLQRNQRGHIARSATRELARTRESLVAEFLQAHPQWQRTPSANDLQAAVLPRLDSGSRLGAGAFGCVYKPRRVWHFPQGGIAVKAVSLRSAEAASGLALEAALLRRVVSTVGQHPNLVGLHSTFLAGEHARLALDLATSDLYDHMWRRRGLLPRASALELARQLAAGLSHLHAAEVAHRDLKLSNALLFARPGGGGGGGRGGRGGGTDWTLKIADLGLGIHSSQLTSLDVVASPPVELVRLAGTELPACLGVTRDPYGTATTMAPEVLAESW